MGCSSSIFSAYTVEEVEAEIANFAPRLPVAVLMNGGISKLEGKITPQEYYEAINYINKCTAHTNVGLSKIYLASERSIREQLRVQAGMAAVQQINQRHPSLRFTYQQTAENMQINTSWSADPALRFAQRGKAPIGNASITALYISVN
ncbi:unnamed protein product [Rotaria sp. Silwood2]|nr:unnamed protein product [Rotaria sp. Silwood2]CAF4689085.1 unnamed protein product [Rotaria sp. Silwood2]